MAGPPALQHERVIDAMRRAGPIMPVRFGALFSTRRALEDWSAENLESIDVFLGQVADKDEWTVRLSLELGHVTEELAGADPVWSARLRALPESPGARYLRKKRLDEDALQEARRRSMETAGRVRAAARAFGEERVAGIAEGGDGRNRAHPERGLPRPSRRDCGVPREREIRRLRPALLAPGLLRPVGARRFCPNLTALGD